VKATTESISEFVEFVNREGLLERLESAKKDVDGEISKEIMKKIFPLINSTSSKIPFSTSERSHLLSNLYSMIQFFGLPSWYWSFAPHDIDSHMVITICAGSEILELPSFQLRAEMIARNPVAAARYFERIINTILEKLIRLPCERNIKKTTSRNNRKSGILGIPLAHFTVSESQGRGTLHGHGLGWGGICPKVLQNISTNSELKQYFGEVIDSFVSGEVPKEYHEERIKEKEMRKNKEIVIEKQASPAWDYSPLPLKNPEAYERRVFSTVSKVNYHNHSQTCHKGKAGRYGCRLGQPSPLVNKTGPSELYWEIKDKKVGIKENIQEQILINDHSTEQMALPPPDNRVIVWEIKRSKEEDGYIVTYSPAWTACTGSNSAIYPLYSQQQAKSIVYYVCDYITKGESQLTNIVPLIREALNHIEKFPSRAEDSGSELRNSLHFMSKILNDISGMTECSAPMAACPLLDIPSSWSSHKGWYIYIYSAIERTKQYLPENYKKNFFQGIEEVDCDFRELEEDESFFNDAFENTNVTPMAQVFKVGEVVKVVHQDTHYQCRGINLENINLLEYCCTIDIIYKNSNVKKKKKNEEEEEEEEEGETEKNEEKGETEKNEKNARLKNATFEFKEDHPLYQSHIQRMRSKIFYPMLAGRSPPRYPGPMNIKNKNWRNMCLEWVIYMCVLLIPWDVTTGSPKFLNYKEFCNWLDEGATGNDIRSKCRRKYLENISRNLNINSEMKKMMTMFRTRNATVWGMNGKVSNDLTYDSKIRGMEELEAREGLYESIIEDIQRMALETEFNSPEDVEQNYISKNLNSLQDIYSEFNKTIRISNEDDTNINDDTDRIIVLEYEAVQELQEYLGEKEDDKELDKYEDDFVDEIEFEYDSDGEYIDMEEENYNLKDGVIKEGYLIPQPKFNINSSNISDEDVPNLTDDQNEALKYVIRRIIKVDELRAENKKVEFEMIFLHGGPGVGKSYWAHTLHERITKSGFKMISCALCGTAASGLPRGQTFHSLFGFSINDKRDSYKVNDRKLILLRETFKSVKLFLLDELSMISPNYIGMMSYALKKVFNSDEDFGGLAVVVMGDMFQIPTIGAISIPQAVIDSYRNKKKVKNNIMTIDGIRIVTRIFCIPLLEQMRAKNDPILTKFLEQFRNPSVKYPVTNEFISNLKVFSREDVSQDPSWLFAPILVSNNNERAALTKKIAPIFANYVNKPLICWKKKLKGLNSLSESHESVLYSKCPQLIGYFIEGTPGFLQLENKNTSKKVTNGSPITYRALILENEEDKIRVRNAKPGEIVWLEETPVGIGVRLTQIEKDISEKKSNWDINQTLIPGEVVIPIVHSKSVSKTKIITKKKNITIEYFEICVELGFSITFCKVQGKTMDKIIIDLNQRPGNMRPKIDLPSLFVACSRVQLSENMRILPLHPNTNLNYLKKLTFSPYLFEWLQGFKQGKGYWNYDNIPLPKKINLQPKVIKTKVKPKLVKRPDNNINKVNLQPEVNKPKESKSNIDYCEISKKKAKTIPLALSTNVKPQHTLNVLGNEEMRQNIFMPEKGYWKFGFTYSNNSCYMDSTMIAIYFVLKRTDLLNQSPIINDSQLSDMLIKNSLIPNINLPFLGEHPWLNILNYLRLYERTGWMITLRDKFRQAWFIKYCPELKPFQFNTTKLWFRPLINIFTNKKFDYPFKIVTTKQVYLHSK
jgi:hypothetical protein